MDLMLIHRSKAPFVENPSHGYEQTSISRGLHPRIEGLIHESLHRKSMLIFRLTNFMFVLSIYLTDRLINVL